MDLFNREDFNSLSQESIDSLKVELKRGNAGWSEWLNDETEVNMGWVRAFEFVLHEDLLNYQHWIRYISYIDKFLTDDISYGPEFISSKLHLGLQTTRYDVKNSHKFLYFCHKYWIERGFTAQIKSAYESQLTIPFLDSDNALSRYSTLLTQCFPDIYDQSMTDISKLKAKTSRLLEKIITWEDKIDLRGDYDAAIWKSYISWLSKAKDIEKVTRNGLVKTTFERSIPHSNYMEAQWVEIWNTCLPLKLDLSADSFCKRLVEQYATKSTYANILYLKHIDPKHYIAGDTHSTLPVWLKENVFELIGKCESYDLFCELSFAFLTAVIRFSKTGSPGTLTQDMFSADTIREISLVFEEGLKFNNVFHSVEKFCIEVFCHAGLESNAKQLLKQFLNDPNCRCQVDNFIFARSVVEKFPNPNFHEYAAIGLKNWKDLDWPERLYEEWTRDSFLHGYQNSDTMARKEWKKIRSYYENNETMEADEVEEQQEDETAESQIPKTSLTKRKATDDLSNEPKRQLHLRDRENLSIRVYNLPDNVLESELREFFKTQNIRSVTQRDHMATIEFSTNEEVLFALSTNGQLFKDKAIEVQKSNETTIWVTNYPPEYSQSDLHNLFSSNELKIMSIRLPSLRNNANRRFCYIEYVDNAMALEAIRLFDTREIQDSNGKTYKLTVKISSTSNAKDSSSDNGDEGKEVFVNRLNFYKVTEDKLREAFSRYGAIKSVKLPLSANGREANRLNDGYGFIIFATQEEAQKSLEMNGKTVCGHSIGVSLAEKRGNKNKKVSIVHAGAKQGKDVVKSVIRDKTITVMNLDDTINSAQLTQIFKEIGPVYKTVLIPEKNGAYVEFEEVADAGKCGMAMNGKVIGKSAITIVPGFALNKQAYIPKHSTHSRVDENAELGKPDLQDAMEVDAKEPEKAHDVPSKPVAKSNDYFRNLVLNKK